MDQKNDCRLETNELLSASKLALSMMEMFFMHSAGKATIKRLRRAIDNLEAKL
jgi:hypothetical protein